MGATVRGSTNLGRTIQYNLVDMTVDTVLSNSSTNPVQNKVITDKIEELTPLTGTSAPTTSTEGVVGQFYVNTSSGELYVCTKVDDTEYTWTLATGSSSGSLDYVVAYTDEGDEYTSASASAAYSTALGYASKAPSLSSTAIGYNATISGASSVVVGADSASTDLDVTAIGYSAQGTGEDATAIGYNSQASYHGVSIGSNSKADGTGAIAIGKTSSTSNTNSIVIGYNAEVTADYAIQLGTGTNSTSKTAQFGGPSQIVNSVSIYQDSSSAADTTAGYHALATEAYVDDKTGDLMVLTNGSAPTTSTEAVVGQFYVDLTNNVVYVCTAVSDGTYTWTQVGGSSSDSSGSIEGIVLNETGTSAATAEGDDALAMGTGTITASGDGSIAIGTSYRASYDSSTIATVASGARSIAIGPSTSATSSYGIVIGATANSTGLRAMAMGYQASAQGAYSLAFGSGSTVKGNSSIGLGYEADATADYTLQIGRGTNSTANSIQLGGVYHKFNSVSIYQDADNAADATAGYHALATEAYVDSKAGSTLNVDLLGTSTAMTISVVSTVPTTYDANTIYFVKYGV